MDYKIQDGVTQGMLVAWMKCRQAAMYRVSRWTRDSPRVAALLGDVVHNLLDWHYSETEEQWEIADYLARQGLTEAELDDKQNEAIYKAYAIFDAYLQHWGKEDHSIKWRGTEEEFAITEPISGVLMRGKRDAVFIRKRRDWLFETKTSSSFDEEARSAHVTIDFQTFYYMCSMYLETGKWPAGVYLNIIVPPGIRLKQKQTPEEFREEYYQRLLEAPEKHFIRFEVSMPSTFLESRYYAELVPLLREFKTWAEGHMATYRNSDRWNCVGSFQCDYLHCCTSGSMVGYRRGELFPELPKAKSEGVGNGKGKSKTQAQSKTVTECSDTATRRKASRRQ